MTLLEWQARCGTAQACYAYLAEARWPEGLRCPACAGTKTWRVQRGDRESPLYECATCHRQASLTAGTIFHRTKVPLPVWFLAIYLVAVDKGGKSALALRRELGVAYRTAWLLPHKIQRAMDTRHAAYELDGLVHLDEAYLGGVSHGPGKQGRGTDQDPVVVGVSLTPQGHPPCTFLNAVPDLTKETVLAVLARRVDRLGLGRSDDAAVYAVGAAVQDVDHPITPSDDPAAPSVFRWIHTVISLAKTFIEGTYHGRARRPLYLDEYTYRFNRRHFDTRIADRLLVTCLQANPYAA